MNPLILCTAAALNIFSMPAGNTVVGTVPYGKPVYLMDGSLMRDWVFIGKPGPEGVSPRGWVKYEYLGQCPLNWKQIFSGRGQPAPQEENGS